MTIPHPIELARHRGPGICDVCTEWKQVLEPHHILKRGMGGGSTIDLRINLLEVCRRCHTCIEDAAPIVSGPFAGACLREADQFRLVHYRELIPLDLDLQAILWVIDRAPKEATPAQLEWEARSLTFHERVFMRQEIARWRSQQKLSTAAPSSARSPASRSSRSRRARGSAVTF